MNYYLAFKGGAGGVVRLRIMFWGLCIFTNEPRDKWFEDCRKALFHVQPESYPFLKFHIIGNLWWANRKIIRETLDDRKRSYIYWRYCDQGGGQIQPHEDKRWFK